MTYYRVCTQGKINFAFASSTSRCRKNVRGFYLEIRSFKSSIHADIITCIHHEPRFSPLEHYTHIGFGLLSFSSVRLHLFNEILIARWDNLK